MAVRHQGLTLHQKVQRSARLIHVRDASGKERNLGPKSSRRGGGEEGERRGREGGEKGERRGRGAERRGEVGRGGERWGEEGRGGGEEGRRGEKRGEEGEKRMGLTCTEMCIPY